jgi:carbon storage regulator
LLVLSRKIGEKLVLVTQAGERIEVMLTEQRSDGARIGIEAPKSVAIWRGEIMAEMDAEFRRLHSEAQTQGEVYEHQ